MAWEQKGNLKGPKGDPGAKGDKGDPGARGADGTGIQIVGEAATYAGLPSNLGPTDTGKGYLVKSDGKLYIWSGTSFPADGAGAAFQGPVGPQGPAGPTGPDGAPGPKGDAGAKGDPGNQGLKGDTGAKGDTGGAGAPGADGRNGTKWFNGTGAPGVVSGAVAGDMYLDNADGTTYELT